MGEIELMYVSKQSCVVRFSLRRESCKYLIWLCTDDPTAARLMVGLPFETYPRPVGGCTYGY